MSHLPAPDSDSRPRPDRRTVLRTAAWSVPAVTVASAAPAFAASPGQPPRPSVDMSSAVTMTTTGLTSAGVVNGTTVYSQGTTTVTATFTNNGPDPAPVGILLEVNLPVSVKWERSIANRAVGGTAAASVDVSSMVRSYRSLSGVDPDGDGASWTASRMVHTWTTIAPIPPGGTVTISFDVVLRATRTGSLLDSGEAEYVPARPTQRPRVRVQARAVPDSNVYRDSDTTNNLSHSTPYFVLQMV